VRQYLHTHRALRPASCVLRPTSCTHSARGTWHGGADRVPRVRARGGLNTAQAQAQARSTQHATRVPLSRPPPALGIGCHCGCWRMHHGSPKEREPLPKKREIKWKSTTMSNSPGLSAVSTAPPPSGAIEASGGGFGCRSRRERPRVRAQGAHGGVF
jgi:hypothetical protein